MVDEGKIAFTIAVEISYLTERVLYELYEVMNMEQCTTSLSKEKHTEANEPAWNFGYGWNGSYFGETKLERTF